MQIRRELPEDHQKIHQLTADAFAEKAFSDGTEPAVIDKLRATGDLTLSLVALIDNVLAGHVAFSPVSIGDTSGSWYGLGPISVQPDLQGTGIGTALINEGFRFLATMKADGCALIGDPNYYSRFGFVSDGNVHYPNVPDKIVQWRSFTGLSPSGLLVFNSAFD